MPPDLEMLYGTAEAVPYNEPDNTSSNLDVANLARKRPPKIRIPNF
jgi:hypothetical protein